MGESRLRQQDPRLNLRIRITKRQQTYLVEIKWKDVNIVREETLNLGLNLGVRELLEFVKLWYTFVCQLLDVRAALSKAS